MRTKFKSKAKDCRHPADAREWTDGGQLLRVLKCSSCGCTLRNVPVCVECNRNMVPDGRESYGGKCIFVKCPKDCQIPILWNKDAYYGTEQIKDHPFVAVITEDDIQNKKPVFAWTDDEEKPSHRWHYGRQEWVKLERRN